MGASVFMVMVGAKGYPCLSLLGKLFSLSLLVRQQSSFAHRTFVGEGLVGEGKVLPPHRPFNVEELGRM